MKLLKPSYFSPVDFNETRIYRNADKDFILIVKETFAKSPPLYIYMAFTYERRISLKVIRLLIF